jgi:outer membrane protein OmpA-like peptidoglycan-associated protein
MRRLIVCLLLLSVTPGLAHAAEHKRAAPGERFVVFFQEWSAALDEPAQTVITHAAEYAKAHPGQFVHVSGFADTTGSRKANALLTDLRVQVVIDQLQTDGVPVAHIIGRGHGSVKFALTSQESRRVEVGFAGH